MSVTVGSVWRPAVGRGTSVVVKAVGVSTASVLPFPPRARRNPRPVVVALTAGGAGLQGYTATGQRG